MSGLSHLQVHLLDFPKMQTSPVLYLVRHCEASGQEPDASLTRTGLLQADDLAKRFRDLGVRRIVSSPYIRARQSIQPLATLLGLPVDEDPRLRERHLGFDPEWPVYLRQSFEDLDGALPDGESSRAAMERGIAALDEVIATGPFPAVVSTHGQLLTLIRKHFDPVIGFDDWAALTNPDVFRLEVQENCVDIWRVWS